MLITHRFAILLFLSSLVAVTVVAPTPSIACVNSTECDDGNPCTDDLCDSDLGCVHANVSNACDDGNACSVSDACNGGTCVGGTIGSGCTSCQAIANVPAAGGVFVGTTSGSGSLSGSCGSSAGSPDRVYRWTPTASGTAVIGTCGSGTLYDTVVHVHAGTCGGAELGCNDDTTGCTTGEPNDHHGSRVTMAVTAGQTYVIVVDGYNGASGTYTLTIAPPSTCNNGTREGAEECDGADVAGCPSGQCTTSCTCVPPSGGLPDLVPQIADVSIAFNQTVASGDVVEGCAEATSGIDLLRFGAYSRNDGTADFVLGDPQCPSPCDQHPLEVCGDPDFICSPAQGHNHAHYNNYARYDLLDGSGQTIVVGHKQGYCLRDNLCASPVYTCGNQGISAGCADIYGSNLGCQYLDITGVPAGTYTLRVTIDPFNRITELSEANNIAQQPVTITRPGGATPTRTATRTPTRTPTPSRTPTPTGGATAPGATASPTPTGGATAIGATTSPTPGPGCAVAGVIPSTGGTVTGVTSGASAQIGTCGVTAPSPEHVYQWTAASGGTWTISTCSTATRYDTVMYLRSGTCGGAEVGCNDDTAGCGTGEPNDHHGSVVTLTATAGQTYFIFVDGYNGAAGAYSLSVVSNAVATSTPTRTATPIVTATATPAPTVTRTATATPVVTATATPVPTVSRTATATPVVTATATPAPTVTRTATATPVVTATATPAPTVTRTATPTPAPTVTRTATATPVATRTATAAGTVTPSSITTAAATPTTTATTVVTATTTAVVGTATPTVTAGRTATATPTPAPTVTPTPATTTTPSPAPTGVSACAAAQLIPSTGGTFNGTTNGASTLGASCANAGGAPERVYRWIPLRSGSATIETCSSTLTSFDTVLSVRRPDCTGPERACNNDTTECAISGFSGRGSRVTLNVRALRTYFIVVDGQNGASGNYQLRVTPP